MTKSPEAEIHGFFDEPTNAVSYIVADPASKACAVIDSVLDYDAASGHTATTSADAIVARIKEDGLKLQWILRNPCPRRPSLGRALYPGEARRQTRHR